MNPRRPSSFTACASHGNLASVSKPMMMRTREFREAKLRRVHLRYLIMSAVIALFMVAVLLIGFVLFMRLVYPLD